MKVSRPHVRTGRLSRLQFRFHKRVDEYPKRHRIEVGDLNVGRTIQLHALKHGLVGLSTLLVALVGIGVVLDIGLVVLNVEHILSRLRVRIVSHVRLHLDVLVG